MLFANLRNLTISFWSPDASFYFSFYSYLSFLLFVFVTFYNLYLFLSCVVISPLLTNKGVSSYLVFMLWITNTSHHVYIKAIFFFSVFVFFPTPCVNSGTFKSCHVRNCAESLMAACLWFKDDGFKSSQGREWNTFQRTWSLFSLAHLSNRKKIKVSGAQAAVPSIIWNNKIA